MKASTKLPTLDSNASIETNASIVILSRLNYLYEFEPCLADEGQILELHQMRIAVKRLRYSLEMFEPIFKEGDKTNSIFAAALATTKSLQEKMGDIHDADILSPHLLRQLSDDIRKGIGKKSKSETRVGVHLADLQACQGLLTLCGDMQTHRDGSFSELTTEWDKLTQDRIFESLREYLNGITHPQRTSKTTIAEKEVVHGRN